MNGYSKFPGDKQPRSQGSLLPTPHRVGRREPRERGWGIKS